MGVTPVDATERSACGTGVSFVQGQEVPVFTGDRRKSLWGMTLQTNP